MTPPVSILLPGLDGTAKLFGPFVAAAPHTYDVRPVPLPNDQPRDYLERTDCSVAFIRHFMTGGDHALADAVRSAVADVSAKARPVDAWRHIGPFLEGAAERDGSERA